MSRYQPLTERLTGHTGHEWRTSFAELEDLLGFPLPKAARSGRSWWTAPDKPHARAWRTPGWEVGDIDPHAGFVTFHRPVSEAAMQTPPPGPGGKPDPLPMKVAAKGAAASKRARAWGMTALIAAGAAVAAGITVAVAQATRRGSSPPA